MNLTEEQRRKILAFILEKLGWSLIPNETESKDGHLIAFKPDGSTGFAPDFCRSLDACHEAEKALTKEQQFKYAQTLLGSRGIGYGGGEPMGFCFPVIHATAEQRALALFQTLGGQL